MIHFSTCSCFLSHPGAFWGAFLAPILAVMVFNVVIFIWVIVVLVRHTRGTAARKKEAVGNKTIIRLMISISGVMFLFGLTWLFAILTFSAPGLRETFQALFTVFNSFQGFFIFLFFCVFSKEAREYWKEVLSCGRYTSQFLHPSQTRNVSSSATGADKKKAILSSETTSSTAEKSRYVSDTTSQDCYESSTIIKQVATSQTEKIPLDYECPKQSVEKVQSTIQTFKDTDSSNGKSTSNIGNDSTGETSISVLETCIDEKVTATQQSNTMSTKQEALAEMPSTTEGHNKLQ